VQLVEVDVVGLQALQAGVDGGADVPRIQVWFAFGPAALVASTT
jgi:hypothetical protein